MKHFSKMMVIKALLSMALLTPMVTNVFAMRTTVATATNYAQLPAGLTAATSMITMENFANTLDTVARTWFLGQTPREHIASVKTNVEAFVAAIIVKVNQWAIAGQDVNASTIDLHLWQLIQYVNTSIGTDATWESAQTALVTEFRTSLLARKNPPAATPATPGVKTPKELSKKEADLIAAQAAIKAATAVIINPLVVATNATSVTVEGIEAACIATKQAIVTRFLSGQAPVITGHDVNTALRELIEKIPAEALEKFCGVMDFANDVLTSLQRPPAKVTTSAGYLTLLKKRKDRAKNPGLVKRIFTLNLCKKPVATATTELQKAAHVMLEPGILTDEAEKAAWEAAATPPAPAATPKKAKVAGDDEDEEDAVETPAAATPTRADVEAEVADLAARATVKVGDAL